MVGATAGSISARRRAASPRADLFFRLISAASGVLVLCVMGGIFIELLSKSRVAVAKFGLGFLTSPAWNPVTMDFGAASSIYGTLASTAIALLLAVPLSLVIALFLVELAPPAISKPVGTAIELLAAIPSIIYGMWGLFVFAPFMSDHVQPLLGAAFGRLPLFQGAPMGIGMLTAGMILALMILPFVSATMRDVFHMVPPVVREAAHGMGSTTWEATRKVTMRYGLSGLIGAVFLGLGRAIGETMAVTFVIGNSHDLSISLFAPGASIASTLANEFTEASEPTHLSSLVTLGLVLFLMTFAIQAVTHVWLKRIRLRSGSGL